MELGHWLVQQGIYRDAVAAAVGVIVTNIFAWRPFRKLQRNARKASDLLDTNTPGGLTDVLNAIMDTRPQDAGPGGDDIGS